MRSFCATSRVLSQTHKFRRGARGSRFAFAVRDVFVRAVGCVPLSLAHCRRRRPQISELHTETRLRAVAEYAFFDCTRSRYVRARQRAGTLISKHVIYIYVSAWLMRETSQSRVQNVRVPQNIPVGFLLLLCGVCLQSFASAFCRVRTHTVS